MLEVIEKSAVLEMNILKTSGRVWNFLHKQGGWKKKPCRFGSIDCLGVS